MGSGFLKRLALLAFDEEQSRVTCYQTCISNLVWGVGSKTCTFSLELMSTNSGKTPDDVWILNLGGNRETCLSPRLEAQNELVC